MSQAQGLNKQQIMDMLEGARALGRIEAVRGTELLLAVGKSPEEALDIVEEQTMEEIEGLPDEVKAITLLRILGDLVTIKEAFVGRS